jgi:hypothetical protein
LLHPIPAEELTYTRRDREKGVLVNTPTFTWAYTRTFKERGKKEIRNSIDVSSFPMQWDAFHLNRNKKWVTKKY